MRFVCVFSAVGCKQNSAVRHSGSQSFVFDGKVALNRSLTLHRRLPFTSHVHPHLTTNTNLYYKPPPYKVQFVRKNVKLTKQMPNNNSSSSEDSEDEATMMRLREATDQTLLNNSMFQAETASVEASKSKSAADSIIPGKQ